MIERARPKLELPLGDTPPPSRFARWWLAGAAVGAVVAALAWPPAGVVALAAVVAFAVSTALASRSHRRGAGRVTVTDRSIDRVDVRGSTRLVDFAEPFGVTLLAAPARDRALFAFTTRDRTRFLSVDAAGLLETDVLRELLADASIIPDGDAMASRGPALRPEDALSLLRALRARSERALGRLFLSTSDGEPLVLDGPELQVGVRFFDLRAPLEWRAFMFHESVGAAVTLYQATWVRQSGTEIVLVAPMPSEVALPGRSRSDVGLHPSAIRDLRLLQSSPEPPPPRELRRAVERVFMVPLRRALDAAPRASRNAPPTRVGSGAEA